MVLSMRPILTVGPLLGNRAIGSPPHCSFLRVEAERASKLTSCGVSGILGPAATEFDAGVRHQAR